MAGAGEAVPFVQPFGRSIAIGDPEHCGPVAAFPGDIEDREYLQGLPDSKLPLARRTGAQKNIHAENVKRVA